MCTGGREGKKSFHGSMIQSGGGGPDKNIEDATYTARGERAWTKGKRGAFCRYYFLSPMTWRKEDIFREICREWVTHV